MSKLQQPSTHGHDRWPGGGELGREEEKKRKVKKATPVRRLS
jgi:hypothetical protein